MAGSWHRLTAYDPDLKRLHGYSVAVMDTRVDAQTIKSVIVITRDDGPTHRDVCT